MLLALVQPSGAHPLPADSLWEWSERSPSEWKICECACLDSGREQAPWGTGGGVSQKDDKYLLWTETEACSGY